ncbi:MAG: hypothetical protein AAB420_02900 [Patescibacteria group bacterium]
MKHRPGEQPPRETAERIDQIRHASDFYELFSVMSGFPTEIIRISPTGEVQTRSVLDIKKKIIAALESEIPLFSVRKVSHIYGIHGKVFSLLEAEQRKGTDLKALVKELRDY